MLKSLFRRFVTSTAVAVVGILVATAAAGASPLQSGRPHVGTAYTFTTLDNQKDPTFNQLLGINNSGVIAGYFGSGADAAHPNKGYTLSPPYGQGNYTAENYPGSVQTQVTAITNVRTSMGTFDTAGFWIDGTGINRGFISWDNVFTSYMNPNTGTGTVNQLLGINDHGIAVGFYTDGQEVNHGYMVNQETGNYSAIVPPGGSNVTAAGINNNGDVVGFMGPADASVSFLMKGGSFSALTFPNSTSTQALGVNRSDQIVGVYTDNAGKMHGFVLSSPLRNARWQTIDDPHGRGTTTVNGLSDNAKLVGFYVDGAGKTHGFLATKAS